MKLIGANRTLRLVTLSAANLDVAVYHATSQAGNTVQSDTLLKIADATTTVICAAPGADAERTVYMASVQNRHASLSCGVAVEVFDGTEAYRIAAAVLAPGETFTYDGFGAWRVLTAQGNPRVNQTQGILAPTANVWQMASLGTDVVNNNPTANVMQDITGLGFGVLAGRRYRFKFDLDYTSALNTTGARFSINGPSMTRLAYRSRYALTSTTETVSNAVAFDVPAAANASPANTGGNVCTIDGFMAPAVDGFVIGRFASEVASSAVTVKAGSTVEWMEVA